MRVMLVTCITRSNAIKTSELAGSSKILVLYYVATVVFLLLDYAVGFNVRVAFLEPYPAPRAAYYGVCFVCLGLMLWRPAWAVLIAAFESIVTLSALIISMGMRTILVTDRVLETGAGLVTMPEIFNFLISGGVAYLAWVKGINQLKDQKWH
ncbi:MAG: hypothetical protein ACR2QZ_14890 [Woeseiaceae bacterium]